MQKPPQILFGFDPSSLDPATIDPRRVGPLAAFLNLVAYADNEMVKHGHLSREDAARGFDEFARELEEMLIQRSGGER
jgi:hypothetical protein